MGAFQLFIDLAGALSVAAALTRFIVWLDTPRKKEAHHGK